MNTTPTTEQRLARLETQSRRWKLAAVGLAGLVIGGLVVGFGPGDKYRGDFDRIDDAFLDYLEAGGEVPVPKLVGITNNERGLLTRLWSNGEMEALSLANGWKFSDGNWIPDDVSGVFPVPPEALAWHPVNVEP